MTSTSSIDDYGRQVWRNQDGKLHRLDGPAVIYPDGSEEWYVEGKRHRIDSPAYIGCDGTQAWWVNGKRHRIEGPAVICPNGYQVWYVDGNKVDPDFISQKIKHNPPTPKEKQLLMDYWGEGSF